MSTNNWGGKRPGAGRPKGSRNKHSIRRDRELARQSSDPLAFLLAIMRDETVSIERRCAAAVAAAPYCHRRK